MEAAKVQHVSKASSDELLRKFAEIDADPPARAPAHLLRAPIVVRKKSRRAVSALSARELSSPSDEAIRATRRRRRRSSGGLGEWKSLLPISNRRPASLLRRMGIRRSEDGGASGIALFLAAALEKTWRKTVEGASKMFVEKQRQNHVRLISDMV
ncbi:hypothetical protein C4D60_Mb05t21050 [Musa balbisiana]|uniref:Uncharacterized protein n=1 Tax=Musa balbisiana TaxID=52838 RepID=A0A4S8JXR9_MUSBA|nr:hypothetical protein C4D60_Mb05t21050 [Musa balbisiana]